MSLLVGYYAALNAEKQAQTALAYDQGNLVNQQTANFGDTAAAQRGLVNAQTQATLAGAGKTGAEAAQVPLDSAGNRDLNASRADQNRVTTGLLPSTSQADVAQKQALTRGIDLTNKASASDLPGGGLGVFDPNNPLGRAKGGMVPAKGEVAQGKAAKPGPTDTVPAMLTPGEAVLNKGAVAHYGSDVISHMNKMGLLRMGAESEHAHLTGQPDPHAAPAKAKGKKAA